MGNQFFTAFQIELLKAVEMKPLELLKIYLHAFGILERDSSKQALFTILKCVHFSIFISNILTNLGFFLFQAHTMNEYSESSFYVLCSILDFWWYLVFFSYRQKFKGLFDDLDALIARSKWEIRVERSNYHYNVSSINLFRK